MNVNESAAVANSEGFVSSFVACATPCRLQTVTGFNSGPNQYVFVFDLASAPAGGTAVKPRFVLKTPEDIQFCFDYRGRPFTTGLVLCNSTSPTTYAPGGNDCLYDVQLDQR